MATNASVRVTDEEEPIVTSMLRLCWRSSLRNPTPGRWQTVLGETPDDLVMSPVNYLEAAVRVDQFKSEEKALKFDALIQAAKIEIVPVTAEQAYLAREAYKRFGKGNHAAKLNLGDCFAYALSKRAASPCSSKATISARPTSRPRFERASALRPRPLRRLHPGRRGRRPPSTAFPSTSPRARPSRWSANPARASRSRRCRS